MSSNIKTVPHTHNKRPVWKKVFRVGEATVAIIDESIVELLQIDEDCWFEEIPMKDGIFLKISSKIESHDASQGVPTEAKKEICRECDHDNYFRPSFEDVKTSIGDSNDNDTHQHRSVKS